MNVNIIDEEKIQDTSEFTNKKIVILLLGGWFNRIYSVIELAKQHPDALVFISTEERPLDLMRELNENGIEKNRIKFDYQAWDTVSNFTKTKDFIIEYNPDVLFVVTNYFHMRRSMIIARIMYLFSGIKIIPYSTYLSEDSFSMESNRLVYWDGVRAALYILYGIYPQQLGLKKRRMKMIRVWETEAKNAGYL